MSKSPVFIALVFILAAMLFIGALVFLGKKAVKYFSSATEPRYIDNYGPLFKELEGLW